MKKLIILTLFLFLSVGVFAQTDMTPAVFDTIIVQKKNKTIKKITKTTRRVEISEKDSTYRKVERKETTQKKAEKNKKHPKKSFKKNHSGKNHYYGRKRSSRKNFGGKSNDNCRAYRGRNKYMD